MYKIYGITTTKKKKKKKKKNTIKLPFVRISSKAGNDINRVQTISNRKIFAHSNSLIFSLIQ